MLNQAAQCYSNMKEYAKAKEWYKKTMDIPSVGEVDKLVEEEVKKQLSKL